MPWSYRILLILNVLYCSYGMITKQVPAWGMFEKVLKVEYKLLDAHQNSIDLRDYLPGGAYLNHPSSLFPIVQFICKRYPELTPLTFSEETTHTQMVLTAQNCNHAKN